MAPSSLRAEQCQHTSSPPRLAMSSSRNHSPQSAHSAYPSAHSAQSERPRASRTNPSASRGNRLPHPSHALVISAAHVAHRSRPSPSTACRLSRATCLPQAPHRP